MARVRGWKHENAPPGSSNHRPTQHRKDTLEATYVTARTLPSLSWVVRRIVRRAVIVRLDGIISCIIVGRNVSRRLREVGRIVSRTRSRIDFLSAGHTAGGDSIRPRSLVDFRLRSVSGPNAARMDRSQKDEYEEDRSHGKTVLHPDSDRNDRCVVAQNRRKIL